MGELEDEEVEDMLPSGIAVPEDLLLWGPAAAHDQDLPDLALFRHMAERADMEDEGQKDVASGPQRPRPQAREEGQGAAAEDFDEFLDGEYGEEEIGACEEEEIEGSMSL